MITQQDNIDSGINTPLESLSACIDGELIAERRSELLVQVAADGALQAQWSLYHCIGDVLRSDELSCHAGGFNTRFAAKLATEPHVFAPRAARAIAARQAELQRSRWIKPASLAASMAAVAVVAGVAMQQWVTAGGGNGSLAPTALMSPANPMVAPVSQSGPAAPANQMAQASLPGAYLAAHRQYASQRTALYVQTVAHDSGK
ncbi:MAG TPA: sigma-E factor negative regulatory protein [Burkholderiales bacterium]|jgi:sigma-E factor negative regulatory protein RseA|nr:sigma-E factor negative regulatory protein [Burkholderiales bacterium]